MHECSNPPGYWLVRLRITRRLTENIDGIKLDHLEPHYVYEVGVLVGCYLLAVGAAEPVDDDGPALVLPIKQQLFGPPPFPRETRRGTSSSVATAQAADKPRPAWKARAKNRQGSR